MGGWVGGWVDSLRVWLSVELLYAMGGWEGDDLPRPADDRVHAWVGEVLGVGGVAEVEGDEAVFFLGGWVGGWVDVMRAMDGWVGGCGLSE